MLSPNTLEELRTILREDYGRELSAEEAGAASRELVGFFDTLASIAHDTASSQDQLRL